MLMDEVEAAAVRFAAKEPSEAAREQARQSAVIGIAGRLVDQLEDTLEKGLPPEAERLRAWRDKTDADASHSSPIPNELAYQIAFLTLAAAASSDALGAAVQAAVTSFAADPSQSFLQGMTPYLGVTLMMVVAKIGYVQGVFALDPGVGQGLTDVLKAMAALTGHPL